MLILSCDIGATNTRIAIIDTANDKLRIHSDATFSSNNFDNPQDIIAHAIATTGVHPEIVGLGIAGPIRNQCSETINLPWRIDGAALKRTFGLSKLYLLNDLEAIAWGIAALESEDYFELHPGKLDPNGNLAVIAAGTGLGEAGVCRQNGRFQPFAAEGGHTDFAPSNQLIEWELLRFLANRYGHVSWERVVSGLGIPNILEFLCQYHDNTLPTHVQDKLCNKDGAALIVAAADAGGCPLCEEALNLFLRIYGREAGNHALKIMATGGVYLAGGIAPKILTRLKASDFLQAFFDKGRMQPLMHNMPIRVILNHRVALYGVAMATMQRLDQS